MAPSLESRLSSPPNGPIGGLFPLVRMRPNCFTNVRYCTELVHSGVPMRIRGLLRRCNRYFFRVRIPADLRAVYERTREYKVALNTSDPAVARMRAMEEGLRAERVFEGTRRPLFGHRPRAAVWRLDTDVVQGSVTMRRRSSTELHSSF